MASSSMAPRAVASTNFSARTLPTLAVAITLVRSALLVALSSKTRRSTLVFGQSTHLWPRVDHVHARASDSPTAPFERLNHWCVVAPFQGTAAARIIGSTSHGSVAGRTATRVGGANTSALTQTATAPYSSAVGLWEHELTSNGVEGDVPIERFLSGRTHSQASHAMDNTKAPLLTPYRRRPEHATEHGPIRPILRSVCTALSVQAQAECRRPPPRSLECRGGRAYP